jgi:CubicO group peptidase (beta-lactamase class C family)
MGDGWSFYRTDRDRHHEHVLSYLTPGPPLFAPGTSFKYHDPAVHLLGYILTRVSGIPLAETIKTRVVHPIGMKHFTWSDYGDRDGILFNNPAGTPGPNQGGVYSNALDLARYALLYLNEGVWNGKSILDPSFVKMATSTQVPAKRPTKYYDLTGRYGFFWWTNGVRADGTRPWPAAPPRTFNAHGAGRNFIFVVPEWNLILVRLSPAPGGHIHLGATKTAVWQEFFARLRPAIRS